MEKNKVVKYVSGLLLGILVVLAGCNTVDVSSQIAPSANLKQYKTFAWLPSADTATNSLARDPILASNFRAKVNQELQEQGYVLNAENPDLLVNAYANYSKEIDLQSVSPSYGYFGSGFYGPMYDYYYPNYGSIGYLSGGPMVREVEYTEGTVVLDFIDAKRNEVVWRGTASDAMYEEDEIVKETLENVEEIFEEFPG
jgi:hypothetical protein